MVQCHTSTILRLRLRLTWVSSDNQTMNYVCARACFSQTHWWWEPLEGGSHLQIFHLCSQLLPSNLKPTEIPLVPLSTDRLASITEKHMVHREVQKAARRYNLKPTNLKPVGTAPLSMPEKPTHLDQSPRNSHDRNSSAVTGRNCAALHAGETDPPRAVASKFTWQKGYPEWNSRPAPPAKAERDHRNKRDRPTL